VGVYKFLLFTFEAWPVLQALPDLAQFSAGHAISRFDEFALKAVLYAGPMLAIVLLVDFVFSLMSVFAPQLQTYFAAFPIKSLLVLLVLALYVTVLLSRGEAYFLRMLERETQLLQETMSRRP
jgi:type III secretion protein T